MYTTLSCIQWKLISFYLCVYFIGSISLKAQTTKSVSFLHDGTRGAEVMMESIKKEAQNLLGSEYDLAFNSSLISGSLIDAQAQIKEALNDRSDVLISIGFIPSGLLYELNSYPKPCIAGVSLSHISGDSSGIHNFTQIETPFRVGRDLRVFQSVDSFNHLAIFCEPNYSELFERNFKNWIDEDVELSMIGISNDPMQDIDQLDEQVDAVYFLPYLYDNDSKYRQLIEEVNMRKIPSFSLLGREDVEKGVLASIASSEYVEIYGKRMALNLMKLFKGINASELPVKLYGIEDDFVINVETMERLEVYPPLQILNQASFINLNTKSDNKYTLESAIAIALNSNLEFESSRKNVDIQKKEVGIAQSNLYPSITANSSVVTLDNKTSDQLVMANQLTPQTNWTGNLELQQLIFSNQAWANVSIQRALLKMENAGVDANRLDLTLDIITSYFRLLQAQANLDIQNSNVQTTLTNLNIAKTKAGIGAVSNADIYGFESQLALNKTSLLDAQTSVEQAKLVFNRILNRPLDEEFSLTDVRLTDQIIFLMDHRFSDQITNQYDIRKFADFLIVEAFNNAPEIKQLELAIKAQELSLNMNKRSLFLPQIGLGANLDKTLGRYGTKVEDETLEALGIDPYRNSWNVGLNVSLPIFQGFARRHRIQKDKIMLDQLELNKLNVKQQFATNIKLSLENLGNSYNDIQLMSQAEKSSTEYLKIVQDLYKEGVVSIVNLLDAQNNALSIRLGHVSTRYQLFIDAITIERLLNKIYLISTQQEKDAFANAYFDYLLKLDK